MCKNVFAHEAGIGSVIRAAEWRGQGAAHNVATFPCLVSVMQVGRKEIDAVL